MNNLDVIRSLGTLPIMATPRPRICAANHWTIFWRNMAREPRHRSFFLQLFPIFLPSTLSQWPWWTHGQRRTRLGTGSMSVSIRTYNSYAIAFWVRLRSPLLSSFPSWDSCGSPSNLGFLRSNAAVSQKPLRTVARFVRKLSCFAEDCAPGIGVRLRPGKLREASQSPNRHGEPWNDHRVSRVTASHRGSGWESGSGGRRVSEGWNNQLSPEVFQHLPTSSNQAIRAFSWL